MRETDIYGDSDKRQWKVETVTYRHTLESRDSDRQRQWKFTLKKSGIDGQSERKKTTLYIVRTVYIGLQVNFNDMAERGTKKT